MDFSCYICEKMRNCMKTRLLIYLTFFLLPLATIAQTIHSWSSDNGLSNTNIRSMFQDSRGNVWILTQNGLNRYDGAKMNVYYEGGSEHTLQNDVMTCIDQLPNGDVLVGHSKGVERYDYLTDQFHEIPILSENNDTLHPYVISMAQTHSGKLYVCTAGVGLLEMDFSDKCSSGVLRRSSIKIQGSNVTQIVENKEHGLWMLFDNRKVGMYRDGKVWMLDGVNSVRSLCYGVDERMYVGEEFGALKVYDSTRGRFDIASTELQGKNIWKLRSNGKGQIFVCTDGDGLFVFDEKTRKVEPSVIDVNDFKMVKSNVKDAMLDRNGDMWVGVYWKGVYVSPSNASNFHYIGRRSYSKSLIGTNCVTAMMMDNESQLWVCTDHCGVYKINPNMTDSEHFVGKNDQGTDMTFMTIFEDSRENLWVGPFNGELMRMNPLNGTLTSLSSLASGDMPTSVYSIQEDCSGNLWIGTCGYGLYYYDVATGRVERKTDTNEYPVIMPDSYINEVFLTGDRLLLATYSGLVVAKVVNGQLKDAKKVFDRVPVYKIRQVKNSNIYWMATSEGLIRYDAISGRTENISGPEGANAVLSLEIADDGHLWISTRQGLFRLDAKGNIMENYSSLDGLQGNEFNERASLYSNGSLYFGGVNGLTYFNPMDLTERKTDNIGFRVVDFYLFGKPVRAGQKSGSHTITDKWTPDADRFNLCYSDNTFSLELAPNSLNTSQMTFSYSVNGREWVTLPRVSRRIEMVNMSPGTYTIRIKGTLQGKDTQEKRVTVVIHPVWFLSAPAYFIYLLLIMLFAWFVYRNIQHRIKSRRLLERYRQDERLNEARTQMFMNISHEIRTPMTLIVSPLESLMKMGDDEFHQRNYRLINQNARRILRLINQLMDSRKIEKGQLKLSYSKVELVRFVNNLYELFGSAASRKNINFLYNHPKDELWAYVDEENLDKIVMNLLSNAFKFTPKDGRIVVYLSCLSQENKFRIEVTDTGVGISDKDKKHIFERFYSSSSNIDNYVGTGIGLNLTYQLIALHGGTVEVTDNPEGQGTRFTVDIPMGDESLLQLSSTSVSSGEIASVSTAVNPDSTNNGDTAVNSEAVIGDNTMPISDSGTTVEPVDGGVASVPDSRPKGATNTDSSSSDSSADDVATIVLPVRKSSGPRRFNVVVVEDDEAIRQYVMNELSQSVNVRDFSDGQKAWDYVLQNVGKVDMVVSDVMMPIMDGIQLCQHIKKNINTSDISVILLTALGSDENRLKGLNVGADGYLSKPFNIDVLKQTVMTLLNNRHRMQSKYDGSAEQADKVDDIELESPDERLMERIMKVMNENIANPDLSVGFIADKVGLSRVHLHRKMKELTSQTPRDFIKNARLKQAAKLLTNKHLDISQVSAATGFRSISFFSTAFRQLYGMTPTDYMKSAKNKNEKEE